MSPLASMVYGGTMVGPMGDGRGDVVFCEMCEMCGYTGDSEGGGARGGKRG